MAATAVVRADNAFILGSITFSPCELLRPNSASTTAALCGLFEVPENWDVPDGRKIKLHLALIRSKAAMAAADPIIFLAGGPGQAATQAYPQVAGALAPLRQRHHILLLDQRGTGQSNPLTCKSLEKDISSEMGSPDLERIKQDAVRCQDELKDRADPHYYTTRDAVRDLEALRQALGSPLFDLVGVSYGTRLAQQYMGYYPQGVRSAVLDGVVPNSLVLGSEFASNLDAALKEQFAQCVNTPVCREQFGYPYKTLYALREQLRVTPQTLIIRDPETFASKQQTLDDNSFSALVRLYAYTPETAALLPLALHDASEGNYLPLMAQAQFIANEVGKSISGGLQLSVICAEDADLLEDRPQDARLILGEDFIQAIRAQCAVWPHGTRPANFHQPLVSDKPVLLLSGEFDPVTPPRYGAEVAKGLSHSRHLVAPGQAHNVMGRGCIPKLIKEFVEKLQPDRLDAGCIADLGPLPAYLNYNGAAP